MKKIKQILVEGSGWFFSKDGEITEFVKPDGSIWFRQAGNGTEFNGKYVIEINYEEV